MKIITPITQFGFPIFFFSLLTISWDLLADNIKTVDKITVTSSSNHELVAKESSAGTKSSTALIRTPQTISVITREQMDLMIPDSVADAFEYTSGVFTRYRGNSNRNDEVISRGFRYSPKFLDGLSYGFTTQNGGGGQIDPWLLERVESIRGPVGVLYGQINPGGMIAMTSKMPSIKDIHKIKLVLGNNKTREAAVDFGGNLTEDNTLFYRFNAIGKKQDEFVKHNRQERFAIAPAITWQPNEQFHFTLLTNYQYDPKAGSRNFLPREGALLKTSVGYVPYDLNVSEPSFDKSKRKQGSIGYHWEYALNHSLSLIQNLRYTHRNEDYKFLIYNVDSKINDHVVTRRAQKSSKTTNELGIDSRILANFNTHNLAHTLLSGFDYRFNHSDSTAYRDPKNDYLFDWHNPPRIHINESSLLRFDKSKKTVNQYGIYLQDQLEWEHWDLVLSGRYDWTDLHHKNTFKKLDKTYKDSKFTWRVGLLYEFESGISPYVSYSTSFDPSLYQNAPDSPPLKPNTGEQLEVGFKYQIPNSDTLFTTSWFQITQKNLPSYNSETKYFEQIGKVESQGFEAELHAQPLPQIALIAAYTYVDITTKSSHKKAQVGHSPAAVPRHTASAWGSYHFLNGFLNGFTLAAGVRYIGDSPADPIGEYTVPHYTLYDAMMKYDLGNAWPVLQGATLQMNAKNLTNKQYVASCSGKYACFYGNGRSLIASIQYLW